MMGIRIPDHSRALIRERLTADPDVATTSLRVSLICPLGKMRLTVPCRAVKCSHLQCFDAALYLQMNEKKPMWKCPVCGKNAPYKSLFIDGLFMDILKECSDVDQIQFQEDGHWRPMRPKKEEIKVSSQSSSDDSSTSDEDPDPHATAKPGEAGQSSSDDSSSSDEEPDPHATSKPGKKVLLVPYDLTSSSETASSSSDTASSEAEPDPPAKKRCLDMSKTKESHSKGVPNGQASDLPSSLSDQSSLATIPADMQSTDSDDSDFSEAPGSEDEELTVEKVNKTSKKDKKTKTEKTKASPKPPVSKKEKQHSKTSKSKPHTSAGMEVENGEEGKNQKKRLHKKEVLRCEVCYVNLYSSVDVAKHNSGKTHRKNLLRQEQEMERLPPRTQEEVGLIVVVASRRGSKSLHCKACNKKFSFSQEEDHIDGQKHRKKLLRLRANKASATGMPKLSSGPYAIRIRSNRIAECLWGEGSFDIFENKINLYIRRLSCGSPIKTFKLNQNVKHIAMNLNRIMLTLKNGAFINLDQMSAALTQKTKEYLEKVKQGKQDSRDCVEVVQPLPILQDHLTSWGVGDIEDHLLTRTPTLNLLLFPTYT